jgi:hypothetical protein
MGATSSARIANMQNAEKLLPWNLATSLRSHSSSAACGIFWPVFSPSVSYVIFRFLRSPLLPLVGEGQRLVPWFVLGWLYRSDIQDDGDIRQKAGEDASPGGEQGQVLERHPIEIGSCLFYGVYIFIINETVQEVVVQLRDDCGRDV